MSRLKLVLSPNPILRAPNFDLNFPLSAQSVMLIDQMIYACKRFHGIGLAAPQIGHNLNLAVINLNEYEVPPFAIINPRIVKVSHKAHVMEEGCLSLPGMFGVVKRPDKVSVKFLTVEGKPVELQLDGLLAKVFQHEIDHLGGIIISDKWDPKTVHTLTPEELAKERLARKRKFKR